jgi:molybdate transport system regulatory protein
MRYGARNTIKATVTTVKKDEIMAQVDFAVNEPCKMSSVLTAESVAELGLAPGDQVVLVVKAVNVMPVKE